MGFLKFLKKSKEDRLDLPFDQDLDIPPPPPAGDMKLPEMPKMPEFDDSDFKLEDIKSDLPSIMDEMPKLKPFEDKEGAPETYGYGSQKAMPEQKPRLFEPRQKMPEPMPSPESKRPSMSPMERLERGAVMEERHVLRRDKGSLKPIFVRVDKFKDIRRSVSVIRNDLKEAEEGIERIEGRRNSMERELVKFEKGLDDMQKKMIFVDKTLFKGG